MDIFIEYECYVIMMTLNHLARWAGGIAIAIVAAAAAARTATNVLMTHLHQYSSGPGSS